MTVDIEVRNRAPVPGPTPGDTAPNGAHTSTPSVAKQGKVNQSPLDKKYHVERNALLRPGESISLAGFMNLLLCLAALGAFGLFFENLNRHGVRIDFSAWPSMFDAKVNVSGFYPAVYMTLYLPVQMFIGLGIEQAIASGRLSESGGFVTHVANIIFHLCVPVAGTFLAGDGISLIGSSVVHFLNTILFLKQWSFVHACSWARAKKHSRVVREGPAVNGDGYTAAPQLVNSRVSPALTEYPDNLNIGNTFYFMVVPTLCYEFDYPRNEEINVKRAVGRFLMCQVATAIHLCFIQQWLIPCYRSLLVPFAEGDLPLVIERLCKVAIPTNLAWLLFFYIMFHVNMIFMSEVTRFGDRRSYDSWWDSEDINAFWRKWNLPVHYWCVRHLYLPLLRRGYSKRFGKNFVFFFSGVFHEYLVSPPLRIFRVYALLGMMAQIPFGYVSEWACRRLGTRWGNAVVWMNVCLGQPMSVMMYFHDYVKVHYGPEGFTIFGAGS